MIRKKLDAMDNRVAHKRVTGYGYTTSGMVKSVKKKLMQKMKDEAIHKVRDAVEHAFMFIKEVLLNVIIATYHDFI
jgi:hypothetical protein